MNETEAAPQLVSRVRVTFPESAQYGNALYRLRKTIKSVLEVEVHKQPDGALIVCAKEELGSLLLLLGRLDGFSVRKDNTDSGL